MNVVTKKFGDNNDGLFCTVMIFGSVKCGRFLLCKLCYNKTNMSQNLKET